MENLSFTLFLEINKSNYIFYVGKNDKLNNFEIIYKFEVFLKELDNNIIYNLEKVFNTVKENIYLIEQKTQHTFKEIVLILDNCDPSFINLVGFKKLNGSQILMENITYILNTLKSCVDEFEVKKKVLHIFNSKFYLDNKKIENLPIGLFGDFYSHELSFSLINLNDYKNLKNIFDRCSLRIKKTLIKSFIKGANISDNYKDVDTFFQIKFEENNSKIFYFENNSLKFEQDFQFGTNIIIKDIVKITSLKAETVKMILNKIELKEDLPENELIEENLFNDGNYRKIKKKLIYEITLARIKEISEIILFSNINFKYYNKISKNIFLEIDNKLQLKCLEDIYRKIYSMSGNFNINFINTLSSASMLETANKLVHFGWKNEAIPITQPKKSIIAGFFDRIFG